MTTCTKCGAKNNHRSAGTRPKAGIGDVRWYFCNVCKRYFSGEVVKRK